MIAPRQRAAADLLERTRLNRALGGVPLWHGTLVLNYHRIARSRAELIDPGVWAATPEGFDAHVALLQREADLIAPEELDDALRARHGRHVLITFDDGYRDNAQYALPVLSARGARAAFFLATGYLDDPRLAWWDEIAWMLERATGRALPPGPWGGPLELRPDPLGEPLGAVLAAYKARAGAHGGELLDALADATGAGRAPRSAAEGLWMSWDEARALRDAGMTVGGHTVDHPVLATQSAAAQEAEIAVCARRLEQELGEPMRWFSYPVGQRASFDAVSRRALRRAGVEHAFSYYGGVARGARLDPYDIPRVSVVPDTDTAALRALLAVPAIFGRW